MKGTEVALGAPKKEKRTGHMTRVMGPKSTGTLRDNPPAKERTSNRARGKWLKSK